MTRIGFLTLLLILCSLSHSASDKVHYIISESCTVQPCLTLSQFAADSSGYLHSNTMLVLLPGIHHLSKVNLTVSNLDNFEMKSENSTAQTRVKCTNNSHVYFSQLRNICITNLEFVGCGGNQVKHVEKFVVEDIKFEGRDNSGTALELIETTAQIISSIFVYNKIGSYKDYYYDRWIGGAIIVTNSTIDISHSTFKHNEADHGGAIFTENSVINMSDVIINANHANEFGVIFSHNCTIAIKANKFHDNGAGIDGILYLEGSTATIESSKFDNNIVLEAGVLNCFNSSNVTIKASKFVDNYAESHGGVISAYFSSDITIEASEFYGNSAGRLGGVLYLEETTISIGSSNFSENISPKGAVFYASYSSKIQYHSYLLINNNLASSYSVIYLSDSEFRGHNLAQNVTFSNNFGSLMAFNSNVTFSGYVTFMNNQAKQTVSDDFQEGGAITLLLSNIFFYGTCILEHNNASNGGAIHSTASKLHINGHVTIAHNTATENGGGVYLLTSELVSHEKSNSTLLNNTALRKGGGFHAISSSIKTISNILTNSNIYKDGYEFIRVYGCTDAKITFKENRAKFGGGLSLEANAKLYILQYDSNMVDCRTGFDDYSTLIFIANSADYGGAVYVDDDTNSGTCASDSKSECFLQVLTLYDYAIPIQAQSCIVFSENYANSSYSNLFGGLLDRCAVSQFAEVYRNYMSNDTDISEGVAFFTNVSNSTEFSISSRPVRVCLCNNSVHCIYQNRTDVKKGEAFTVSLVAVDQAGKPVSATIQTTLRSAESGLAEGQLFKSISAMCTDMTFNVVSPYDSETLTLYASDGPCRNVELSRATVEINFLACKCPVGLQVSRRYATNCTCECNTKISQYIEHCDSHTGLLVKQSNSGAWISYVSNANSTGYYLVYPNCPFGYCLTDSPHIYLNQQNGADAQCAFNRSSVLCGSCQPNHSLSLGSSHCVHCSKYWPGIFITITIASILGGIALVTLLLVLNMTIAVGTLNGLIFYANVVHVNKSILLPFQEINFITVFISWLNLDLGIDTCYFPGMDTYIKTWLQLAFPAYVIFLVILVIIISSYSTKFSNLIGKKDPVATLATLVLLSYAKFLEVCFKSLSVGVLEYPDGSSSKIWLPDATIGYLTGKHVPMFIAAVVILSSSLVYTALLFSWQWLLYLPKWRIFTWSRNPRIQTFIETYHTPYTPKHRYWPGLLLIARVSLYLVAATNVSNDPTLALTAITFVVCCIVLLKGFIISRLYRKWSMDVLETLFCLNILVLTIFTWYRLSAECAHHKAIAYTSVMITVLVLLFIIFYHVYSYTPTFSKIKKTKLGGMIDRLSSVNDPKPKPRERRFSQPPPDEDIHRFDELMEELDCPVYTADYNTAPLIRSVRLQPTYSVVEVHQPHLSVPDPEGASAQNRSAKRDSSEIRCSIHGSDV